MKLVVAHLRALDAYVSREFSAIIRELVDAHRWQHVEFRTLWQAGKPLSETLLGLFGELPEAILFWEGYEFINTLRGRSWRSTAARPWSRTTCTRSPSSRAGAASRRT